MREAGIKKTNPREQILDDIKTLIEEKGRDGYRPIVMMDANGEYMKEMGGDADLRDFVETTGLADPYLDKFPEQIRTYMYGKRRLDYIFMDSALVQAVSRIGYLGSHDAALSDHVQAYVDFDTKKLFCGVINRPMEMRGREFRLEQTDRQVKFVENFIPAAKKAKLKEKVFKLADNFRKHGRSTINVATYQKLDQIFTDMALGSASKVSRKKFGYMRSPELTLQGRMFMLTKRILECKSRNAPLAEVLKSRAKELSVDISRYETMTTVACRKEVTTQQKLLWEAQKGSEQGRIEWLKGEAMDRAKAAGDPDWEKGLKKMIEVAESRAINRKLTATIKGTNRALDRVEIPTHDWFHSSQQNEIYHYDLGNFEAHPAISSKSFFKHHTLKVLPPDATQILVAHSESSIEMTFKAEWYYSFSRDGLYRRRSEGIESFRCTKEGIYSIRRTRDGGIPSDAVVAVVETIEQGRYRIVETLPIEAEMWKDVTTPSKVEAVIIDRNKRHLQQTDIEGGENRGPIMTELREGHGVSEATSRLLDGTYSTAQQWRRGSMK